MNSSPKFFHEKADSEFDPDAECNFQALSGLSPKEIETACKYEYMRESQALRDELENSEADYNREYKLFNESGAIIASRPRRVLPSFAHENLRASERYHLVNELQMAGFPKPWNMLPKEAQKRLRSSISEWDEERKKSNPPVLIEAVSPEPDEELNYDPDRSHDRIYWRLPSEPRLLHGWEQSGRKYFFAFIRIDEGYSQTEACDAFKTWFATQFPHRTHGNPHFGAKLLQLAAMRVRHRFKRAERQRMLAELTGKATYKGDQSLADIQLSRDCKDAMEFFQSLFVGQRPISATRKS